MTKYFKKVWKIFGHFPFFRCIFASYFKRNMYKIYLNRNFGEFGVTKTSWDYYISCYSLTEARQ